VNGPSSAKVFFRSVALDRLGESAELIPAPYLFQNVRFAGCRLAGCTLAGRSLTDLLIDALIHHRAARSARGAADDRADRSADRSPRRSAAEAAGSRALLGGPTARRQKKYRGTQSDV
jgi:hypothetical protein